MDNIQAHTAFQTLFYSGMRCGEMSALTLADFDFKANTINVNKTLYRTQTGAPKTDNGIRIITMPVLYRKNSYSEVFDTGMIS